jgi:hypothetical protein
VHAVLQSPREVCIMRYSTRRSKRRERVEWSSEEIPYVLEWQKLLALSMRCVRPASDGGEQWVHFDVECAPD